MSVVRQHQHARFGGSTAIVAGSLVAVFLGYWLFQAWHWDGLCTACLFPWKYSHREPHLSLEASLDRGAYSLKEIAQAEMDFRAHDRANTGRHEFWRADIAGLYAFIPDTVLMEFPPSSPYTRASFAMKLVELSIASADDQPMTDLSPFSVRAPKSGYWFRALHHEGEVTPSPDRFAACMFPADRSFGKWTMIISESNVIFYKDLGDQNGPEYFPADPLKAGWRKLSP